MLHYKERQGITQATQRCVKSVPICSFFGPYFPAFGLNTERYTEYLSAFSPNAGNTDQKDSEYGHFSRSAEQNRTKNILEHDGIFSKQRSRLPPMNMAKEKLNCYVTKTFC